MGSSFIHLIRIDSNEFFLMADIVHSFKKFLFIFIFGCTGSSLLVRAFASGVEWGLLSVVVQGLLIAVAPLVEQRL